jgi:hypothetical protein
LGGNATVVFGASPFNEIVIGGGALVIARTVTIRGGSGSIVGDKNAPLLNQGQILSDSAGGTITINVAAWTNTGTIRVASGASASLLGAWNTLNPIVYQGTGTLLFGGTWSYAFPITCNGGTLTLEGNWSTTAAITATNATLNLGSGGTWNNDGTISATNCTVNLGSSFTAAQLGVFERTGGTVNLIGTLLNTGLSFVLGPDTGSWVLAGGTIQGGTITESGASGLLLTTQGGTLNAVTFNGSLSLSGGANMNLTVAGNFTLNGSIYVGGATLLDYGTLTFGIPSDLESVTGASIVFGYSQYNRILTSSVSVTFGKNVLIHGQSGGIVGAFVNDGTISADVAGGTIFMDEHDWTNAGTVEATAGGNLVALPGTNDTSGTLTGGKWIASDGTLLLLGANIGTNAATIILSGPSGSFQDYGGDALANLSTNASSGQLTIRGGYHENVTGSLTNAGQIEILFGGTLTVGGVYTQTAGTTLLSGGTLAANPTVDIEGGVLTGTGTIQANLNNAGLVQPGGAGAPGVLIVVGNYVQTSAGVLDIDIGGTAPGTQFDQIKIGGQAMLDGTLNVTLVNGFTVMVNDRFRILTFSSVLGDFATEDGVAKLDPVFYANSLTLVGRP